MNESLKIQYEHEIRQLEQSHAEQVNDLRAEHAAHIEETEERLQKRIEEERERLVEETQSTLQKLTEVKDHQIEVMKESFERKSLRAQVASSSDYEELKEQFSKLQQELIKYRNTSADYNKARSASDIKLLRSELNDLKRQYNKKCTAYDRVNGELEKVRTQMQTNRSVSETKMALLKNKIKGLEAQVVKKSSYGEFSTPNAKSSDNGTETRLYPISEPRNIQRSDNLSLSPFLSNTISSAAKNVNTKISSSPVTQLVSRLRTPVAKTMIPQRNASTTPRLRTRNNFGSGTRTAEEARYSVRKKRYSLLDDDLTDDEPERDLNDSKVIIKSKRRLNSDSLDIFEMTPSKIGTSQTVLDHEETGGPVKRLKLSKDDNSDISIKDKPEERKVIGRKKLSSPSVNLTREISPTKSSGKSKPQFRV